jgi:hypothetical protein
VEQVSRSLVPDSARTSIAVNAFSNPASTNMKNTTQPIKTTGLALRSRSINNHESKEKLKWL